MPSPSDRKRNVAVVGATGAVGEVVLELLAKRSFPVGELRALASGRSAGSSVRFAGRDVPVREAKPEAFDGVDFAFFAATGALSKELAPEVARRGGVAIDKSSTWRMDPEVPLVVPEINPDALEKHRGIVACPNCTTIGFVMALEPLRRAAGLAERRRDDAPGRERHRQARHRGARARSSARRPPAGARRRRPTRRRSRTTCCRCASRSATTATRRRR